MNLVFLILDIYRLHGEERVTVNLANMFAGKGYQVDIVTLSGSGSTSNYAIDNRVEIRNLNLKFTGGIKLFQKIAAIWAVRKHFGNFRNPTIILGISTLPGVLLALLPKRKNIHTIFCHHNPIPENRIWRTLRKLLFCRLDALVGLTYRGLPYLKKQNPNSFVIPNAVSFYPPTPAALESKTILLIGRMEYEKGYDLLFDVFSMFSALRPDWKLRIVGNGTLREEIISRIENSGLKEQVEIHFPTDQILTHFLESSVYLMTSRAEVLPMVLLEAQACGLPVVAFDCETGPAEIVHHGVDGYLVKPYDIEEMSERLLELASDPGKRKEFGTNARENVKRFLPSEIFKLWDEVFTGLGCSLKLLRSNH